MEEGRKDDGGKAPIHLINPSLLFNIADVLGFGARKYAERNWEQGIAYSRVFAALQRHLWQWWDGTRLDAESGLPHLAHAACCLMFLIAYTERPSKYDPFDDRPEYL